MAQDGQMGDIALEDIFDAPTPPRPTRAPNANPLFFQPSPSASPAANPDRVRSSEVYPSPAGGTNARNEPARRNLASALSLFDDGMDDDDDEDAIIAGRENAGEPADGQIGTLNGVDKGVSGDGEPDKGPGKRTIARIDAPR